MADVWLKIQPNNGKGSLQISVSSLTPHTGRIQRQTISIANVINDTSKNIKLNINQAPKTAFTTFMNNKITIDYTYQFVNTIKITTNARGIKSASSTNMNNFRVVDLDGIGYEVPYNYKDDPGANNKFETLFLIDALPNYTLNDRESVLNIEDTEGNKVSYTLTQKGIDVGIANMTIGKDFIIR
jgi:hypothetical protein